VIGLRTTTIWKCSRPAINVKVRDITKIATEAIVNSSNPSLFAVSGVSGAIHRAAGPELEGACWELWNCPVADAVITPALGLPATWVIHAVGPRWLDGMGLHRRSITSITRSGA
jgi:O-acetyl-ADP-ribose deacetylase (regulator of RNase III)